jgi:hypothetical protein
MKTTALATILALGLTSAAMAASEEAETDLERGPETAAGTDATTGTDAAGTEATAGADAAEDDDATLTADIDLPPIPAEEEATLADCRIWVSTLGEMVERGEGDEDALAEAEDVQEEAMQACDDGNYYDGIVMAAEAIERIDADGDAADALDDVEPETDAAEGADDDET